MSYDPLRDIRSVSKKLVVMLVIIAIFGTVVGLSIGSGIVSRWWFDRETASKKLESDDRLLPAAELIDPDMDIIGGWVLNGLNYVYLSITPVANDKYLIQVETEGCIGSGNSFERTATFGGGVIKTDKPIREYVPYEYDTIYAVHVGSVDCLVPAAKVQEFNEVVERDSQSAKYTPFYYALTRDEDN